MRVTILDDYFDTLRTLECFGLLDEHEVTVWTDHTDDVDELAARLSRSEALVLIRERTAISGELLDRLTNLRFISQRSVYPHIDIEACTRHGIVVSSDMHPGTASIATAELTFGLIIAALRRIPQQVASMKRGEWQSGVGHTLAGRTLGVYGYGRIGRAVAAYARAFNMNVEFWASDSSRDTARANGETVALSREAFFANADVVSIHVRLVDSTRSVITASDLALMKPTSLLVNTSRAGLIEANALVGALSRGRPAMAALDVFDPEPLRDVDDPLLAMDNVICTPHIGYVTTDEWEIQFSDVFRQINSFASGSPTNVINPEVLDPR